MYDLPSTLMLPTPARIAEETAAEFLVQRCGPAARCRTAIPFQPSFLEVPNAELSAETVARVMVSRVEGDIHKAASLSHWIRTLAHKLDELVLNEQVRRTRLLADAQDREMKLRKRAKRLQEEAETTAALAAMERLVDMGEA